MDVLLARGHKANDAERVVAAAATLIPGLSKSKLKRAKKAIKGFCKVRPPGSREPIPEESTSGVIGAAGLMSYQELFDVSCLILT